MATATYFNCWTTLLRYAVNWKSSVELKSRQAEHKLSLSHSVISPSLSLALAASLMEKAGKKWERKLFKEQRNPLPYCYMSKL